MTKSKILDEVQIRQKLNRIAWQIYEANYKESSIIIAGIRGNGFVIAERLTEIIKKISSIEIQLTEVRINKKDPLKTPTELSVKHFLDVPIKKIYTTALIDRKHNRFPIRTDFSGLVLSTSIKSHVAVELGANEGAYLE